MATADLLTMDSKRDANKQKALDSALAQIERQFGKGSIMKLGGENAIQEIEASSTGSLGLDIALGIGGLPCGRVVEIYGPESTGKTTLAIDAILPWLADPVRFFGEALRVLRPGGMLLFSAFGPGSLEQLDAAASAAGRAVEASGFPDLLELGDALTATGFREPVMDVDRITLDYPGVGAMLDELEVTGTALLVDGWSRLSADPARLESQWPGRTPDGRVPLTFEIVYGAAFGSPEGQPRRTEHGEEATFSVDSLLKSRRGSSI